MDIITSRAVRGELVKALSVERPPQWVGQVANTFMSDQASEQYAMAGIVGALREWIGGRQAKGLDEDSITITNKHFEGTFDYAVKDLRRDKFSVIQAQVGNLAQRAMTHPASLLSTLILGGETGICHDGQYFFDDDHSEGSSGSQSNDISVTLSDLPVDNDGTSTNPSVAAFQLAIAKGVQQMMSFKDPTGEPMNEMATKFVVMVPPSFFNVAVTACATPIQVAETQTALGALKQTYSLIPVVNTRLSSWTTKFALFLTDSYLKPFIFQRETNIRMTSKAEGSEYEHDYDRHQWGVDYWGNVAYGLWWKACLVTLA